MLSICLIFFIVNKNNVLLACFGNGFKNANFSKLVPVDSLPSWCIKIPFPKEKNLSRKH